MDTKRLGRIAVFTVLILALVYFLPKGPVSVDSGEQMVMGTFARIVAVAPHRNIAQKAIEDAFGQLRRIEQLASVYIEDSQISKVNSLASKEPVNLSDSTFQILQAAVEYGRLTDGAFDITVGPLIDLWQKAAEANQPPDPAQLEEVRRRIGFDKIVLNPVSKTVRLSADGMKLDLGGIAKGYAIDKAVETLQAFGAVGAMVDLGGDIRCFGIPAGGKKYWLIGVQNPDLANKDRSRLILKLNDTAVATSGDYQRYVLIGSKKQSHIIDTKTGRGSKKFSSVTVIAPKAVDADALATAVSVLGAEKGLELIESLENTEAILISPAPDYEMTFTSGAEKYIK